MKSIVCCPLVLFSVLFLPLPAAAKDPAPSFRLPAWSTAVPAYAIGTLAAFWMFERVAGL